jgi:transcriptional regulator with XRE-family HTH domain
MNYISGDENMRKLAGIRVKMGITQKEAAVKIGVTQGAISLWERGEGKPSLEKIPKLAILYEVTEQEIYEAIMKR